MPAHAIVGAQWGDEGKGKLVDVLAARYDYVARFQGGNNAGHTVKVGKATYKFNLLPSGAVRGRPVVIGNGVVVDPRILLKEIENLTAAGKTIRLSISDRAHVIMPYHVLLDAANEGGAGPAIGTTKRGIGPCYADKAARLGVRMGDLADPARLRARLDAVWGVKQRDLDGAGVKEAPAKQQIIAEYEALGQRLAPHVEDTGERLHAALQRGKNVLFEGAQGLLLDLDHGTYPYVTSSNTVSSNAATGSGVGAHHIEAVLGVAKAYVTRVGAGPFPTELDTKVGAGKTMLDVGREFGTVTGRPRRCGWLDLVALRYAIRVGGITHLAITKMDVLNGLEKIRVSTGYRVENQTVKTFPSDLEELAAAKPVWKDVPGWEAAGTRKGRSWTLDPKARSYLRLIEREVGVPVVIASVGPERTETIPVAKSPFKA